MVCILSASPTVMACGRDTVEPSLVLRVTAEKMPRMGSGWVTGASDPAATGMPASISAPHGVQVRLEPFLDLGEVLLTIVVDEGWLGNYQGTVVFKLFHQTRRAFGAVLDPVTSVGRRQNCLSFDQAHPPPLPLPPAPPHVKLIGSPSHGPTAQDVPVLPDGAEVEPVVRVSIIFTAPTLNPSSPEPGISPASRNDCKWDAPAIMETTGPQHTLLCQLVEGLPAVIIVTRSGVLDGCYALGQEQAVYPSYPFKKRILIDSVALRVSPVGPDGPAYIIAHFKEDAGGLPCRLRPSL